MRGFATMRCTAQTTFEQYLVPPEAGVEHRSTSDTYLPKSTHLKSHGTVPLALEAREPNTIMQASGVAHTAAKSDFKASCVPTGGEENASDAMAMQVVVAPLSDAVHTQPGVPSVDLQTAALDGQAVQGELLPSLFQRSHRLLRAWCR